MGKLHIASCMPLASWHGSCCNWVWSLAICRHAKDTPSATCKHAGVVREARGMGARVVFHVEQCLGVTCSNLRANLNLA